MDWLHVHGHLRPLSEDDAEPRFVARTGTIHADDGPLGPSDPLFAPGETAADVPVVVSFTTRGGTHLTARGRLADARRDAGGVVATIEWPDDLHDLVGDSTPAVHCHWRADGTLEAVGVDLDDMDDDGPDDGSGDCGCGCGGGDAKPPTAADPLARSLDRLASAIRARRPSP